MGGTLGLITLWTGLAAARPQVTYHLAPVLLVWAVPFLSRRDGRRAGTAAIGTGLVVAVATAILLDAAGWLDGPALFGGDALGEALLASVAAALLALIVIVTTTGGFAGERKKR